MIPFSPPRIDQKIIDEVTDTLRSGWITTGPKTKRFEKELATWCEVPAMLCLNSATAGLEIMLRWFGIQEGDEVILPAYTYSATANVIMHCGAKPIFVDVDPDDFNITASNIEKAINYRTRVIMPVDFGGFPCDYDAITALAKAHAHLFVPRTEEQRMLGRILILSDAAHSVGARYKGKLAGSLCDVSVFSFHAVKNLTTAEGGAISLNLPKPFDNVAIYNELCILTLHGQNKDALAKMQKGNWRYDIVVAGYKCNMTDIAAAIGLVELARYESDTLLRRKEILLQYNKLLQAFDWAQLPVLQTPNAESSYHLYPLRIRNITEEQRDLIIKEMAEAGIAVNVHFIPVPMTSFYRNLGYSLTDYPIAHDNYQREISLPVFYDLTNDQIELVVNTLIKTVEAIVKKQHA
ncbi:MAG: DegT/DnrJ/EryC1/StrS family aminotransferase [Bacteroidia bacterium]